MKSSEITAWRVFLGCTTASRLSRETGHSKRYAGQLLRRAHYDGKIIRVKPGLYRTIKDIESLFCGLLIKHTDCLKWDTLNNATVSVPNTTGGYQNETPRPTTNCISGRILYRARSGFTHRYRVKRLFGIFMVMKSITDPLIVIVGTIGFLVIFIALMAVFLPICYASHREYKNKEK